MRTPLRHTFPLAGKVARGCASDGGASAMLCDYAAVTPTPGPAPQGGGEKQ